MFFTSSSTICTNVVLSASDILKAFYFMYSYLILQMEICSGVDSIGVCTGAINSLGHQQRMLRCFIQTDNLGLETGLHVGWAPGTSHTVFTRI